MNAPKPKSMARNYLAFVSDGEAIFRKKDKIIKIRYCFGKEEYIAVYKKSVLVLECVLHRDKTEDFLQYILYKDRTMVSMKTISRNTGEIFDSAPFLSLE